MTSKASNKHISKRTQGLGQINNQYMPLSRAQICLLLSNDQLTFNTPMAAGLALLPHLMLYLLPRVKSEASNVTRGDFERIYEVIGVMYFSAGIFKKNLHTLS